MTSRTDAIRKALQPHLTVFSSTHQSMLTELLNLAQIGERAQSLVSSFSLVGPGKSAPKGATPGRKPGRPAGASAAAKKPAAAPKKQGGKRATGGTSLGDTLTKVLGDAGKPMSIPDLTAAVKAAGYASGSAKFSVVVGNVVAKLPGVKRVGRGLYAASK